MDLSEKIQEGSEEFVGETDKIVSGISDHINEKIDNLNMEKMRHDIEDATKTFLSITEELELLSYNTICRTMALGEKGATITHISKEIKKYSTSVRELLETITADFENMFNSFKAIADQIISTKLGDSANAFKVEAIGDFAISSDVSLLIENSQFHDIFIQEMENINNELGVLNYTDPYEAGRQFGLFEQATGRLDMIKYNLQETLENIKEVLKDFLYTFNTDMQNIVSKTNILRSELSRVHEVSGEICTSIGGMREKIESTTGVIKDAESSIQLLQKQSKTFRNLVVITAVEVARINDDSLRSVVVSMTNTEHELHGLIDTLFNNIGKWEELREDFIYTFVHAHEEMKGICHSDVASDREEMLKDTHSLDVKLDDFREVFSGDKYVSIFDANTESLLEIYMQYVESIQESFAIFGDKLGGDILSNEDFIRGRNEAELKEFFASDGEESSIDFF
jgi:methyl-accepting chemotaxis protein